ncbi:MAG: flagellar biosynthetic protein FliO [Ruminiclostridium sp.]|nr:flagellar biosynthetic protein FliO [Ruminiclostridium sp.]
MDWLQWLLSFIGVIGLIFFLFYALRKLNKGISVKSGSRLRVLDRVSIGRDSMLLVVSVCGKVILLGVTSQRIEKL